MRPVPRWSGHDSGSGRTRQSRGQLLCPYAVERPLDAATAVEEPDVLVDLRPVEFFDCSGLRVLCRAERRARERGGRLRIVSDGPRIDRLLRASGLFGRFPPLRVLPSHSEKPQ
jgi:anti-sigma B factor antagonist